jgi:predicted dehydrogenase
VNLGPPATEVDVIWDLAIHDVAVLLSLADADPVDVQADGSRYAHPRLTDVAFLTLRFGNGFLAKVHVSWLSPSKVRRMFVAGSQGSAVFDDMHPTEKLVLTDLGVDSRVGADDRAAHELFYRPGERRVCPVPDALPLSEECAQFLDCVRFGGRPDADGHAGLAVVRVLDAAQRSLSEGGRSIRLDGRFVPLASAS